MLVQVNAPTHLDIEDENLSDSESEHETEEIKANKNAIKIPDDLDHSKDKDEVTFTPHNNKKTGMRRQNSPQENVFDSFDEYFLNRGGQLLDKIIEQGVNKCLERELSKSRDHPS